MDDSHAHRSGPGPVGDGRPGRGRVAQKAHPDHDPLARGKRSVHHGGDGHGPAHVREAGRAREGREQARRRGRAGHQRAGPKPSGRLHPGSDLHRAHDHPRSFEARRLTRIRTCGLWAWSGRRPSPWPAGPTRPTTTSRSSPSTERPTSFGWPTGGSGPCPP